MLHNRRSISLLLAVITVLTLLAGCQIPPKAPDSDESTQKSPKPTPTQDAVPVNTDKVGDIITFGGYEWQVLDVKDGKSLVITKDIVDLWCFYSIDSESDYSLIRNGGCEIWKHSFLRKWLNAEFYNSFSTIEQQRISEEIVNNVDKPNIDFYDVFTYHEKSSNTIDKVFLLSLCELQEYFADSGEMTFTDDHHYGGISFSDEYNVTRKADMKLSETKLEQIANRICYLHEISESYNSQEYNRQIDYDEVLSQLTDFNNNTFWWLLRTPCTMVDENGGIVIGNGFQGMFPGIRPVLWLYPEGYTAPEVITIPLSEKKVGDSITFGDYDWIILDKKDGKVLIITEDIIDARKYNETNIEITWEYSTIRNYLNGEFYNGLPENGKIVLTTISNKSNPWYGKDGGNDTTDYIFLLSIDEVVRYFGDSGKLTSINTIKDADKNYGRIDDEFNFLRVTRFFYNQSKIKDISLRRTDYDDIFDDINEANGSRSRWWLRSPGASYENIACVDSYGVILVEGRDCGSDRDLTGIRPAMWITL